MRRLRTLAAALAAAILLCACGGPGAQVSEGIPSGLSWSGLEWEERLPLRYAEQFTVDYAGDYALITIGGTERFLVVPEGAEAPQGVEEGITVLRQPLDRIYLVATSAMDLFRALDGIGNLAFSGATAENWYIPEAREAMERGTLAYAGKYSAPDYELLLSGGCDLAIESTMIYHNPEVQEALEGFDIPVLVERSSYEQHPLGRMEWLKLYAVLLDREEEAAALFDAMADKIDLLTAEENTEKTVAFFYITSNGAVNVRKSGDYVAKAITLAGGRYCFPDLAAEEENALSTVNLQMEAFYSGAKDADVLIYNSAIDGELETMEELLEKSGLLADFKAVRTGDVWCTGKNLFQESMGVGALIQDIHTVLTSERPEEEGLTYLHRLERTGGEETEE